MNILIVSPSVIPAHLYGGTERVIWDLGKELTKMGHHITYLVYEGSSCSFAKVLVYNPTIDLNTQIPEEVDIIHFNFQPSIEIAKPYVVTQHGNSNDPNLKLNANTIFVSKNHAERHGSDQFVYNGLDWDEYRKPKLNAKKEYLHFLGKAAWRIKNVKGAINIAREAKENLMVMGGHRFNLKMGMRFTPYPSIKFAGMVDNDRKSSIMNKSKGLLFPVRWHEPFGLALTESLYFGCPVIGTPYGSLPEIIKGDVGFLSSDSKDLVNAVKEIDQFSKRRCHEYAKDIFNSKQMAQAYLSKYETALNGNKLNAKQPKLIQHQNNKFLEYQ